MKTFARLHIRPVALCARSWLWALVLGIAGCGGGGGGTAPATYTVGGTVTGLQGPSLVLTSGTHMASPEQGDTTFTLSGTFSSGDSYAVAVTSVPAGQLCTVAGGSGVVASANVSNVQVTCALSHIIEVQISGLLVDGLVLTDGTESVTAVASEGAFSFPTPLAAGAKYTVAVQAQPTGQTCVVNNGSGVAPDAGAINIAVSCGGWEWLGGSSTSNAAGSYGTLGVGAASNFPGSRAEGGSWRDASGKLWMFGGTGYDSTGSPQAELGDLWQYDPSSNWWTWISGPSTGGAPGVYGTQGVAAAQNFPGARTGPVTWLGSDGTLWLFGGYGLDGTGSTGALSDLWKFDPAASLWTWVGGSDQANALGTYASLGQASPANIPGARSLAAAWTDQSGNFWMFGGNGQVPPGVSGTLSDLWKYTVSSGLWTWVSGTSANNATGIYGTQNLPSSVNNPGARAGATAWVDPKGKFWLFGGAGIGLTAGPISTLNDLWSYDPAAGQWTWISGSNSTQALGSYGSLGIPAITNTPGSRVYATGWVDAYGGLWLFGGTGFVQSGDGGGLNDLWRLDPATLEWAWIDGSNAVNAPGIYAPPDPAQPNLGLTPGARYLSFSWETPAGNLVLFGGVGTLHTGTYYNDFWMYTR